MITVPVRILRLDDLIEEFAVAVLEVIAVFLSPDGIFSLKTFFFTSHSLKLLIKFRSVAVAVK